MVSPWKFWLVSFLAVFYSFNFSFASAPQSLAKKEITLAGKKLKVEIAETPEQQQIGLMFREEMGADEGMLFVFKNEETRFFLDEEYFFRSFDWVF